MTICTYSEVQTMAKNSIHVLIKKAQCTIYNASCRYDYMSYAEMIWRMAIIVDLLYISVELSFWNVL